MSPSKPHPRRRQSPPPKAAASKSSAPIEEPFIETSPIISPEEKHQLILAHSAARAPRDPLQRVTLWGGVAIAFAAILVGWFFTVGHDVKSQLTGAGGKTNPLTERLNAFSEIVDQQTGTGGRTDIPNPTATAAAEEFVGVMKEMLGATGTSAVRDDLFAPAPRAATSSGKAAPDIAPTTFHPEQIHGLEKAQ